MLIHKDDPDLNIKSESKNVYCYDFTGNIVPCATYRIYTVEYKGMRASPDVLALIPDTDCYEIGF